MPDIEYVKAFQKRLEQQTQTYANQIKDLYPDVSIMVITKEGCAACVLLQTALEEQGIRADYVSVYSHPKARSIYDKLVADGQSVIFPITIVKDQVILGNRPDEILAVLEKQS